MFEMPRERLTLEGIGVAVFLVASMAMINWNRVAPYIYQMAPGFRATRTGPPGFPVGVRIGEGGLGVTNGSGVRWTCSVDIAKSKPVVVVLEPNQSRDIPYRQFSGDSTTVSDREWNLRARSWVQLRCDEEGGVSHYIVFQPPF